MTIFNNTQHESIYYSISHKGGVDCGNLGPGDQATLASYDDKPDVKLTMTISKTGDATEVIIRDSGLLQSSSGENPVE
ncbi:MAG TPA: hypothetical protein VEX43_04705 [Chthoniobacterales bacterium]|nr:hypothetical protein [Chthoniobacterales bacterium]